MSQDHKAAATSSQPVLRLSGISKNFGAVSALTDIDLEVFPGEVVALVGDNGAGKSTLVKTLAGVHQPTSGTIEFNGEKVVLSSPGVALDLGIATVFQDLALCENLDVVANIFLGREISPYRLDEVSMEIKAWKLLNELSARIPSVREPVASLSGGQRQTVAISRSLLLDLGIATVFQDLALCENLDVVANIFLGREISPYRLDEVSMEIKAWKLLNELSARIPSVREPVASLSGGQRQTVAISRSLLLDPKLIMLDEPTAALGVAQTAEVLDLIERVRDRGLGVIMISHNMEDVRAVADRIVVLRLGCNNGIFYPDSSNEELVAAITGATSNSVSRRAERRLAQHDNAHGRGEVR
ncbi:hypothetical protein C981_03105 [Brucella abortus 78/32]|uniref:ATP-binding cassette domain-containing protein n=1 Tax=Brucella abortus TaxID=235 RepID=UPI0002CF7F38|nr:ATP-binding cassette domain-containing protein [Brucella abortus]ENR86410.1 hypothetical protein C981_03105 [Brucella abortus 78/32]